MRRVTESPIMNEPIGHVARSGPSREGLRRVPMSHVAVKVFVTGNLEKRHVTDGCHTRVRLEAGDGPFQTLDIRGPGVSEKLVSCRDPRRAFTAVVSR